MFFEAFVWGFGLFTGAGTGFILCAVVYHTMSALVVFFNSVIPISYLLRGVYHTTEDTSEDNNYNMLEMVNLITLASHKACAALENIDESLAQCRPIVCSADNEST